MIWKQIRDGVIELGIIFGKAGRAWSRDNGSRMAAAVAFYASFAVVPLIMLVLGVGGYLFDEEVLRNQLTVRLHEFVGPRLEEYVWEVIDRWQDRQHGIKASVVAMAALGWSSFRCFDALRATLNILWGVEKRQGASIAARIWRRAGAFFMIFCFGLLATVAIGFSIAVTAAADHLETVMGLSLSKWYRAELAGTFIVMTALFAMIFKWVPNVIMAWRDVIFGAVITAILFSIGKELVEIVLSEVATTSVFGAAGVMVTLLLWIYLSAMIFFYGAEITKYWAVRNGQGIRPDAYAVRVERLELIRKAIVDALGEEAACAVDKELGIEGECP